MHGFINRDDMVELIVRVLGDPATAGQTFAAVDAAMARTVNPAVPFPLLPLRGAECGPQIAIDRGRARDEGAGL